MFCRKCGAIIEDDHMFCKKCGTPIILLNDNKKDEGVKKNKYVKIATIFFCAVVSTFLLIMVSIMVKRFVEMETEKVEGVSDLQDENSQKKNTEVMKILPEEDDSGFYGEMYEHDSEENFYDKAGKNIEEKNIDVENEVSNIREKYNALVKKMRKGYYKKTIEGEGITKYKKDGSVVAMIIPKGMYSSKYSVSAYFENEQLLFVYFEGKDSHRLYYSEGSLIRWRYTSNVTNPEDAVNYDLDNENKSFLKWGEEGLNVSQKYIDMKFADRIKMDAITSIVASSSLSENNMTHSAERICDGTLECAWVEGVIGQGIGESISFSFDDEYLVKEIVFFAGYQKRRDLYYKNSRPKKIKIFFSDGSIETKKLKDTYAKQTIKLSNNVVTSFIRIEIESVYEGSGYEDTVISEVVFK